MSMIRYGGCASITCFDNFDFNLQNMQIYEHCLKLSLCKEVVSLCTQTFDSQVVC